MVGKMRGDFNNSSTHLATMGPGGLSTTVIAGRIAEELERLTARPWITYLRDEPPCAGGVYIEAPPDRRTPEGLLSEEDWDILHELFGAVKLKARRWYLMPDELRTALEVLRDGPLEEPQERKRRRLELQPETP